MSALFDVVRGILKEMDAGGGVTPRLYEIDPETFSRLVPEMRQRVKELGTPLVDGNGCIVPDSEEPRGLMVIDVPVWPIS